MKKLAIVMSFLMAAACAARAEQVSDWASGTGGATAKDPATAADLTSANATWTLSAGEGDTISVGSDQTISLDFCDSASTLTLALDADEAPDESVVTRVSAEVAFERYDMTTPPSAPADMQVALIVGVEDETASYYTYTYVGDELAWAKLSGVEPAAEGTAAKIYVEIDVSGKQNVTNTTENTVVTVPVARIAIISGVATNYLTLDGQTAGDWFVLPTAAAEVGSIVMTGSGSVKAIDAKMQLGEAMFANVKYPELPDTVTLASGAVGSDKTVTLQRDVLASEAPTSTLEIPNGVTLDLNGFTVGYTYSVASGSQIAVPEEGPADLSKVTLPDEGTVTLNVSSTDTESGEVTVATGATGKDIDKIDVQLANANKEVASKTIDDSGNLKCTVQTAEAQVRGIKFVGGSLAQSGDADSLAAVRTFLDTYANEVYNGADSSAANMKAVVKQAGANGMPLWQDFVLGITPSQTLATQPTGADSDTDNLHIAIPAVPETAVKSGYDVTYQLVNTDTSEVLQESIADVKNIEIPVGSGHFKVQAKIEAK